MKKKLIDFCIPYVNSGLICLEYLIENALQTADNPSRIKFNVTYHSESDLISLKQSKCFKKISKIIYSKPYSEKILFYPSANHSLAINNLAKNCESEIIVFCDYDMAFVKKGWDNIIEDEIYKEKSIFAGVTYQPRFIKYQPKWFNQYLPYLINANFIKYQNIPNLSFFCISKSSLKEIFNYRLTSFENFLTEGNLPFRIINTNYLSKINNLPLGAVQWLDTGYEIPEIIYEKKLKYKSLLPIDYMEQNILDYVTNAAQKNQILLPEIFMFDSNIPFICHFKKASSKMTSNEGKLEFENFKNCIDKYLTR